MANKLVNITKAFTLTLVRGGEQILLKIEAGIQRLEDDVADHWYTKAHSADVPKGVQSDTQEEDEAAAKAAADAKAAEDAAAEKKAADEAAAKAAAKK